MPNTPLKQLGKYQLTDILGQGAMGVVYRAFDPVLNRYLAIKVMSALIASDEQLRDRFLREAQAAGSLQHPNVVTVYDFGEADEHLFIAMEYIEGVDLAEMIERRDPLSVAAKLDIMIDALNGLAYAHSHGLVHRDIKPANIRVGDDHRAKLMDFGIARMGSAASMTQTGALLGTPQYMAPEQVTGAELTAAADIFAAGAVLYEFLTYTKPFGGDSLHVILYKIVSEDPPPMRTFAPDIPEALEPIVARALAKDPAMRYPSALTMAKALTNARNELTGTAERPTVTIRGSSKTLNLARRPGVRRSPVMAVGVATTVVAAAVALWAFGPWKGRGTSTTVGRDTAAQSAATVSATAPGTGPGPTPAPVSSTAERAATALPVAAGPGSSKSTVSPARARGVAPLSSAATQDSMIRAVRTNIAGNRRRAQEAGATAAELAIGDSLLASADALVARGRGPDAVQQLSMASVRWMDAERGARDRAARARSAPAPERSPVAPPAVSAPAPQAPAVPAPSIEKANATAAIAAPADARPEIERVIAAYARAIESGNIDEIRRAYPGITAAQQQQWGGFFRSVRNFKARLVVDQLAVNGANADAHVSAVYTYESRGSGQGDRQDLVLQATLTRDAGGWRLASIR